MPEKTVRRFLRAEKGLQMAVAVGLGALFLFGFASLVPVHAIHGDEVYYVGRAMQNLGFLEGNFPYKQVTFSLPNHPFSGELFMGLGMLLAGQTFTPSSAVWGGMPESVRLSPDLMINQTYLTSGELDSARDVSLLTAAVAVAVLVYVATKLSWVSGIFGFLFAVSAPGFIDISVTAMLDVYCAAFTVLSIIALYWYIRGSPLGLILSGVFLGLGFGSKLSWDPIIAGFVILTCVLVKEETNRGRIKRLSQNWVAGIISFAVTSPVVVLRFPSEIRDSFGPSVGRFATTNSSSGQSLFSTSGISGFIQPPVLIVYALLAASAMVLSLHLWYEKSRGPGETSTLNRMRSFLAFMKDNPESFFLFVVLAFCTLDLLLGPLEYEFGRNFQRLGIYMALASAVSLAYLLRNIKWRRVGPLVTILCFVSVLLVEGVFLESLGSQLADGTFTYAYEIVVTPFLAPEAGALLVLSGAFIGLVFIGIFGVSVMNVFASPKQPHQASETPA